MERQYTTISAADTAKITMFDGQAGRVPLRTIEYASIEEMARNFRKTVSAPAKQRAPLYSRCECVDGRLREDTRPPFQVVLDVDGSEVPMQEASSRLRDLGVAHFAHTTWKHAPDVLETHNYRIVCDLLCSDWQVLKGTTEELARLVDLDADPVSRHQICFYLPATDGNRVVERVEATDFETEWRPDPENWPDELVEEPRGPAEDRDPETIDVGEVWEALGHVDNVSREQWIRTGQCLHGSGMPLDAARTLWDAWSMGEDHGQEYGDYSDEAQERAWGSFGRSGNGLGLSTIFYDATEGGWEGNRRTRQAAAEQFDAVDELDVEDLQDHGPRAERRALLRELSGRYAYVAVGQGKVWDDVQTTFLSKSAFLDLHVNPEFETGQVRGGEPVMESIGRSWWQWPQRPSFAGIDFAPPGARPLPKDVMNLWHGWAVEPTDDDLETARLGCSRFLDHVHGVVCAGDDACFEWVVAWMAHLVQRPYEKPKTAIVMRSDEGTGKGIFASALVDLAGQHGIHVGQSKQLTGQFTQHLANKLVLFADEVTWGGARQEGSVLKYLVSENKMMVEPKGVDAFQAASYLRTMIAGNGGWVVPAGNSARRYMVLDVDESRTDDEAYFLRILDELYDRSSGGELVPGDGMRALLRYLQLLDPATLPNPRRIIKTEALLSQKIEGLDAVEAWLYDSLKEARLGMGPWPDGPTWVASTEAHRAYAIHAEQSHSYVSNLTRWANALNRIFGKARPEDRPKGRRSHRPLPSRTHTTLDSDGEKQRYTQRLWPGLTDARDLMDRHLGQPTEWGEDEDPTL